MWYVRLGSKLRGPFNDEQLRRLRQRGELSAMHQVSSDRITWEPVTSLFEKWEQATSAAAQPIPVAKEAPAADWFYSTPKGERIGPLSRSQLEQLARTNQLTASTLVFGPGFEDWKSARELGLSTAPAKRPSLAVPLTILGVLTVLTVAAVAYLIKLKPEYFYSVVTPNENSDGTPEPTPDPGTGAKPPNGPRITSVVNNSHLNDALARVQILIRYTLENGSVVELPESHGTGFCVTPSGYFLTNRHVIESYSDETKEVTLKIGNSNHDAKKDMAIVLFIRGIRFPAKLIHTSSKFDLAVVKINRNRPLPYFELSNNPNPPVLTEVFALGFPGVAARPSTSEEAGMDAKFQSEFSRALSSKCLVSAETQLPESAFGHSAVQGSISKVAKTDDGQDYVFHTANIFGGNSGGPLVDKKAVVLGINTMIQRDLKIKETTLSDGSKSVIAINDGNLNQTFLSKQFRAELSEFVPEKLYWR